MKLKDILSGNFPAAKRYKAGYEQMPEYLQDPYLGLSTSNIGKVSKGLLETKVGEKGFDPRFDPRAKEQLKLQNLKTIVDTTGVNKNIPTISLANFEGRPFITSMSDRTAAGGKLLGVNDVMFNRPVDYFGGQDFMFQFPYAWSSGQQPTKAIIDQARLMKQITGQDPLYIPHRMAPTGSDFSPSTGETMLNYADAAMGKSDAKNLDKVISKLIPNWSGINNPESINQFRAAPDTVRKKLKSIMNTDFRDRGGLGIGEARLAIADPKQINAPDAGIMNIGQIFADKPMVMNSGHPAYPRAVQGEGLGRVDKELKIFELLPQVVKDRKMIDPKNPSPQDMRALQMKPYAGILTPELLKILGY